MAAAAAALIFNKQTRKPAPTLCNPCSSLPLPSTPSCSPFLNPQAPCCYPYLSPLLVSPGGSCCCCAARQPARLPQPAGRLAGGATLAAELGSMCQPCKLAELAGEQGAGMTAVREMVQKGSRHRNRPHGSCPAGRTHKQSLESTADICHHCRSSHAYSIQSGDSQSRRLLIASEPLGQRAAQQPRITPPPPHPRLQRCRQQHPWSGRPGQGAWASTLRRLPAPRRCRLPPTPTSL